MLLKTSTRLSRVCFASVDVSRRLNKRTAVAVVAFKAVVNFELQRRENDRRVGSILAQASDMMGILLQLVNRY